MAHRVHQGELFALPVERIGQQSTEQFYNGRSSQDLCLSRSCRGWYNGPRNVEHTSSMKTAQTIPACSSCGKCCIVQGSGFTMLPEDYRRWKSQRRGDILLYIWLCGVPSECEITLDVWIDWIDPRTGEILKHCPFLRKVGRAKYTCTIHDTKPCICERFWCEAAFGVGRRGVPLRGMGSLKRACDDVAC